MRRTKIAVTIALFIAWGIFVALMVAAFIAVGKSGGNNGANPGKISSGNSSQNPPAGNSGTKYFTAQEVASHNSPGDCWTIINGKVYDLTSFAYMHSGGSGAILEYCGKDGTNAFLTKDRNPAQRHQGGDTSILANFYVGDLKK